jgi:hypothetical protein
MVVDAPKMLDENVARYCVVPASDEAALVVSAEFAPNATICDPAICPGRDVAFVASDVFPDPSAKYAGVSDPAADRNFFMM